MFFRLPASPSSSPAKGKVLVAPSPAAGSARACRSPHRKCAYPRHDMTVAFASGDRRQLAELTSPSRVPGDLGCVSCAARGSAAFRVAVPPQQLPPWAQRCRPRRQPLMLHANHLQDEVERCRLPLRDFSSLPDDRQGFARPADRPSAFLSLVNACRSSPHCHSLCVCLSAHAGSGGPRNWPGSTRSPTAVGPAADACGHRTRARRLPDRHAAHRARPAPPGPTCGGSS